ncbi:MAG: ATP-binding protein [Candidatus Aenigmarchaeota archaeon]|nr:ATP-binding protein [Candidatus Aenigmarchaeota archaeon]
MSQLYVVTGGPSTGKTLTLGYLERRGFYVVYEAARIIIDEDMAKGRSLAEIRADEIAFQRRALEMKIEVEKTVPRDRTVFLDRGVPDSVPYLQVCSVDVMDEVKQILGDQKRYRRVFLMEHIGFKGDYARTEDGYKSRLLSRLLKEVYQELGYDVVDVPPLPAGSVEASIIQRGEFILKSL